MINSRSVFIKKDFYFGYLFCLIALPLIPGELFFDGGLWVSLQLLVSAFLISFFIFCLQSFEVPKVYRPFFIFPIMMMILIAISLVGSLDRVILGDTFEFLRPLATIIFLTYSIIVFSNGHFSVGRFIYRPLSVVTLFFFIIFVFQVISIPYLQDIHGLYFRDKDVLKGKFVGSFSTTYIAGFYFIICFSMFFSKALLSEHGRGKYIFLAFCSAFLIIYTQSRSSFMGWLATFTCIFIVFSLLNFKRWIFLSFIMFSIVSGVIVYKGQELMDAFPYLSYGIRRFVFDFESSAASANSLGTRLSQFHWAVDNNPRVIVGAGILKDEVRLLESWFALYYFRYGILGMLLYFLFWFGLGFAALSSIFLNRKSADKDILAFLLGFSGIIAALPFALMSSIPTEFMSTLMICSVLAGFAMCLIFSRKARF